MKANNWLRFVGVACVLGLISTACEVESGKAVDDAAVADVSAMPDTGPTPDAGPPEPTPWLTCQDRFDGTLCHDVNGPCDLAEFCDCGEGEVCDASESMCPADAFKPAGTSCPLTEGGAGICDGTTAQCHVPPGFCTDKDTTDICRNATSSCDVAEYCDGVNADCPVDVPAPEGTACSVDGLTGNCDDMGVCVPDEPPPTPDAGPTPDAEVPDAEPPPTPDAAPSPLPDAEPPPGPDASPGTPDATPPPPTPDASIPPAPDASMPDATPTGFCWGKDPSVLCRNVVSSCDLPEYCDGTSSDCPADVIVAAGTGCLTTSGAYGHCNTMAVCVPDPPPPPPGPDAGVSTPDAGAPPSPDAAPPPSPDAALPPTPDASVPPAPDASLPDASPPPSPDAAPPPSPDAAPVPSPDAALPTPDAASPPSPDASVSVPDAGVSAPDASVPSPDASVVLPDAAPVVPDAAPTTPDAMPPDASVPGSVTVGVFTAPAAIGPAYLHIWANRRTVEPTGPDHYDLSTVVIPGVPIAYSGTLNPLTPGQICGHQVYNDNDGDGNGGTAPIPMGGGIEISGSTAPDPVPAGAWFGEPGQPTLDMILSVTVCLVDTATCSVITTHTMVRPCSPDGSSCWGGPNWFISIADLGTICP